MIYDLNVVSTAVLKKWSPVMNVRICTVSLATAALLSTLMPSPACAQKKQGGVIRLETTTIEGRVQKPTAFFINTRNSLVYESLEIKESFVGEIVKVVDTGDF
jgi:hypothetical protein